MVLTIFLFGILVFGSRLTLKSLSLRDFSFLAAATTTKLPSQGLFIEPPINFLRESPEMTFIQSNSIVGISSPTTIHPQILGSVLGGGGEETARRWAIVEYVVESGDTLSSIAKKFGISLETILWANDLTSKSIIKIGQKLIISPVSGVIHHVKNGDTLGEIAKTYKGEIEEIVIINELSSEGDIFIGDILIIPDGKMPPKISRIASTSIANSYFIFPSQGRITQRLHYYNAVDIANKCGTTPVVAAAGGTIQRAGFDRVGGNRITILHSNGVVTYYGHLSKMLVSPGQSVGVGDIIGYVGNTGYATGCHLHFAVIGAKNFLSRYSLGSYISWKR